jgi:predicted dithiol-disulfide oxidoreductase (DUF899 family)
MDTVNSTTTGHRIVTREEWLAARRGLLASEKALTRLRDRLSEERRALPRVRVEKLYRFDTPAGPRTLAELFEGRSQLIVNHFMFGPSWPEGCVGCSFGADHLEGALVHLAQRDVAYVAVSRAPLAAIEAFKRRMGWRFSWVSSLGSDFNFDFHVSFTSEEVAVGRGFYNYEVREILGEEVSGLSVFARDASGDVFHTYSTYARGGEELLGTYVLLDLTPKGRDEGPDGNLTRWVRHHDRYDAGGFVDHTGRYRADSEPGCPACQTA